MATASREISSTIFVNINNYFLIISIVTLPGPNISTIEMPPIAVNCTQILGVDPSGDHKIEDSELPMPAKIEFEIIEEICELVAKIKAYEKSIDHDQAIIEKVSQAIDRADAMQSSGQAKLFELRERNTKLKETLERKQLLATRLKQKCHIQEQPPAQQPSLPPQEGQQEQLDQKGQE